MQESNGKDAGIALENALSVPTPHEVRDQLARILGSPEFLVPERVRAFLCYIVEQTLAGHAERLKGYTIATMVFERDVSFDAQADPVVRTEAARLRRALERYYLVAGGSDPVTIEIPKGGYVPTFSRCIKPGSKSSGAEVQATSMPGLAGIARRRAAAVVLVGLMTLVGAMGWLHLRNVPRPALTAEAEIPADLTLLVIPFDSLSVGDEARLYAAGVTEEILTQLSRFKDLAVLGRETMRTVPAGMDSASIARELSAHYVLTGSLRVSGSDLRVTSRLLDTDTGSILWAQTYKEDLRTKALFAIQEDIAHQVVTAVAQPYGVVFRSDLQKTADQPPDDLEAYACTLRFYVYRAAPSSDAHALVRGCLERAVVRFPSYATAWAMLSLLALDEDRFAFNRRLGEPNPIDRALQAARRAVDLDADNARALQSLMMAQFFRGDVDEAIRVGELALIANPQDSELLSEYGLRIALAGKWQRGRELVERALARNPSYSGYYHAVLALIAYMQRDSARAEAEIRQANLTTFSLYHAIAAVIFADRGLADEARHEAAEFAKLHPAFAANLDAELRKRNLRPEDRARLIQGLGKAGLPGPATASSRPSGAS